MHSFILHTAQRYHLDTAHSYRPDMKRRDEVEIYHHTLSKPAVIGNHKMETYINAGQNIL
jgi:hypothetical protein